MDTETRTSETSQGLRIGELAAQAGVSAPTVRFYEREGLLPAARRSQAGYRLYGPEALADLRFIARAKALGLSLEQVKLLRSQPDAAAERRQLRHLVAHQLIRTRRQRAELEALEDSLSGLFAALLHDPEPCACPPEGCVSSEVAAQAAAVLADETAQIEAATCICVCTLDPGCACGCPCCSIDLGTGAGVSEAHEGERDTEGRV
jgi:MerR family copper efflux transcriptional regulator